MPTSSNTTLFDFVDSASVVDDVLRGLGLYICGPDEYAGSLEVLKPLPNSNTVHGTVTVSYCTPGTATPYPFTIDEIIEITETLKRELKRLIAGMKVVDVEFGGDETSSINVHWKTQKSLSRVINDAKEVIALADTSAL